MRAAHDCDTFDALLSVARTFNENCCQPNLGEDEVVNVATSAWTATQEGRNRVGQHGAWFPTEEVVCMLNDQDAFLLLIFLKAHQGPWATFMCANGLAENLRWARRRLAAARSRLIELGYIKQVRQAGRGCPALFRWCFVKGCAGMTTYTQLTLPPVFLPSP
jgi:hypothetical protein